MSQTKIIKTSGRVPVFKCKIRRERPEPTLDQQIQAIKDLGNLLTEGEREVFSKVMDEIEEGKYFKNE